MNDELMKCMFRDMYTACMDEEKIERIGLEPLHSMLKDLGGWPVLEENWDEDAFSWIDTVYTFREHGYSTDYLIDFSVGIDSKNSSWRVIDIDQVGKLFLEDKQSKMQYMILLNRNKLHPKLYLEEKELKESPCKLQILQNTLFPG